MDNELTLRQLRIFATLVREGSMTLAAERLEIRQPSVSQQIARMEEAAGGKLVRFVGGELRLTPAGEYLAAEAEAVLGSVERVQAGLLEHVAGRRRRLIVGALPSLASNLLVPAFAHMVGYTTASHDTVFDVLEMTPREALDRIERRSIDVALISGYAAETPLAPGLRVATVASDAQYLAVPEGLPDLCGVGRPEQASAAALQRIVRLDLGSPHADQLTLWQDMLFPEAAVLARCRSYGGALAFIECGLGTAIMPDLTLRRMGEKAKVDLYALPVPDRRTLLVMPEQSRNLPIMRELAEALDRVAQNLEPLPHRPVPAFARERLAGSI